MKSNDNHQETIFRTYNPKDKVMLKGEIYEAGEPLALSRKVSLMNGDHLPSDLPIDNPFDSDFGETIYRCAVIVIAAICLGVYLAVKS